MKKQITSLLTSIVILFFCIFSTTPAQAKENSPLVNCDKVGMTWDKATILDRNYHIGVGGIFRSGPGGTISSSYEGSQTITVQSSLTASIGTDAIVKASISAGASTAVSSATKTTYNYSHNISPNKYGNLQFGSWGWRTRVTRYRVYAPCTTKVFASGTATLPSNSWGYKYWED